MKYKNIIFDFGNTLIEFEPLNIFNNFFETDESEREVLKEEIFSRKYWDRLDDGTLPIEEYYKKLAEVIPKKYHKSLKNFCDNWYGSLPYIDGMRELVFKLKADGYNIFLLSNILKEFQDHVKDFDIFECFDGIVISGLEDAVKPSDEIFRLILNRYSLNAEECLFVDDLEKNVNGAKSNGINGYLFDGNSQKLENFIYKEN